MENKIISLVEDNPDDLKSSGVPPERPIPEVTESAIMGDLQRSVETLAVPNRMGVTVSIDDFDAGFSSLTYVKKLPVNEIKIDMMTNESDFSIVRSIIDLGHDLGLKRRSRRAWRIKPPRTTSPRSAAIMARATSSAARCRASSSRHGGSNRLPKPETPSLARARHAPAALARAEVIRAGLAGTHRRK